MKLFLKIVKVIAYICTICIFMLALKMIYQGVELINSINEYNNIFLSLTLYPIIISMVLSVILIVCIIIFFPKFIKHMNLLEKNTNLCTKVEILKLISFLIIVGIIISTIIYIYINVK